MVDLWSEVEVRPGHREKWRCWGWGVVGVEEGGGKGVDV